MPAFNVLSGRCLFKDVDDLHHLALFARKWIVTLPVERDNI
jgi:hypothetical protein